MRLLAFAIILALYLLLYIVVSHAAPGQVRLQWDNPRTCADATPFPPDSQVKITVYETKPGMPFDYNTPFLLDVYGESLIVAAPGKHWWQVTATLECTFVEGVPADEQQCCSVESAPSNTLETHQTGRPQRLR